MTLNLVLGLEIHLHLKTAKKMFCGCGANIYGVEPNTHVCPTCLGLPGALPVPNFEAVKMAQLLGLGLNCTLNKKSRFDRKHYFYPDLPKGYQISQYKQPLCENGYLTLDNGKKIEIERVHLEEDTAKSFHESGKTLVDFNKSGMPLVEIVTKPVFKSVAETVEFSKKIQDIVRILGVSDCDMEKGQMRLEANISLRTMEMEKKNILSNYKVEIKNINSFRFMKRAVGSEIKRQSELLNNGKIVLQENRGYDEKTGKTLSQRGKEDAHDYRYFSDPDIPPMEFNDTYLTGIRASLPQLPYQIKEVLITKYKLSKKNSIALTSGPGLLLVNLFTRIVDDKTDPEKTANLLLNRTEVRDLTLDEIRKMLMDSAEKMREAELETIVEDVISKNDDAVKEFKSGKSGSIEFLIGRVMKEAQGKAVPVIVRKMLTDILSK